jgi:cytochrome c oxidase assembly protein subunit 11
MSTPAHTPLVMKCLLGVAAATAFAFALVPLYDTFCQVLGINGKTSGAAEVASAIDKSRLVTVEFTSTAMAGMPWELRPGEARVTVHPGELRQVSYFVKNPTSQDMEGQAVPSVSPGQAAVHLNKIECFCFTRQTVKAGETREMPLVFTVSPDLPADVKTLTLAYAFFVAPEPKKTKGGVS